MTEYLEYLYGGKAYDEDWNEVLQARIITNNLIAEEMLRGRNPEEITNEEIKFPNSMMKHFSDSQLAANILLSAGYVLVNGVWQKVSNRVIKGAGNLKPQGLMDELAKSGVKYNPDNVVMVTKTADGKLLWLENGNASAGLKDIVNGHAADFTAKGISDIPSFLNQTIQNTPINTGMGAGGPFADYLINGSTYRVAYGINGFIVSFYPIN